MALLQLLLFAMLAACGFSEEQTEGITIAYKVLEVYPQSRRVLITCDAPEASQPITYSLLASRGILVAKKVVHDSVPASFNINITIKSSPDLLTYSCQATSNSGTYGPSSRLQMYQELWAILEEEEEKLETGQTVLESDLESNSKESEEDPDWQVLQEDQEDVNSKRRGEAESGTRGNKGTKKVRFAEVVEKSRSSSEDDIEQQESHSVESGEKYIPPRLRNEEVIDVHKKEELDRLKKHVKGLINRLKPVSQLQADFVLRHGDSGPTVELSCLASSGSPPITYRLVGNGGRVLAQQRPLHGKPANFSLPLSQTTGWFQCEAENDVGVDSSARIPLPRAEARAKLVTTLAGELPLTPTCILAGSLVSIAVIASRMLSSTGL
ncbi:mCG19312, isoform CRA_a [Mus musculus]|nr:mCG19312, isoform CRA_a [Mus musculus]